MTGLSWKESGVLGALMNTRGLTELIVLNLALEKGVISPALFAALVIMALITTFMAGPALRLLDPRNEFGAPVEEELEVAKRESHADSPVPVPEHSILVAPQTESALAQLLALAEPLAQSEPRRELIIARVLRPPRSAGVRGGLQTEQRLLTDASNAAAKARLDLLQRGVAARSVALTSARPGAGPGQALGGRGGRPRARGRASSAARRRRAAGRRRCPAARVARRRGGARGA